MEERVCKLDSASIQLQRWSGNASLIKSPSLSLSLSSLFVGWNLFRAFQSPSIQFGHPSSLPLPPVSFLPLLSPPRSRRPTTRSPFARPCRSALQLPPLDFFQLVPQILIGDGRDLEKRRSHPSVTISFFLFSISMRLDIAPPVRTSLFLWEREIPLPVVISRFLGFVLFRFTLTTGSIGYSFA